MAYGHSWVIKRGKAGGRAEESEREENYMKMMEWKHHRKDCLSRRPSWAFYIRVSICRNKISLVDCNMSVVSKFENENKMMLLSSGHVMK
jgi:hypothetical protein